MKKSTIRILLPFCRTLYSQSAASLTMSSVASYLKKQGYKADLFLLDRDNTNSIANFIRQFSRTGHELIIAKVNFQDHSIVIPLVQQLKKINLAAKVALCGPYASMNYQSILATEQYIDVVFVGQTEVAAYEFVQSYCESEGYDSSARSFAYRDPNNNKTIVDPILTKKFLLNDLPLPKRTVEMDEVTPHVNLEASRGCVFSCSFCHLSKTAVTYRSPSTVVKEMAYLNRTLGKTLFIFNDSCFWAGPADDERILTIADGILKQSLDVRLYIYLKVKPLLPRAILEPLVKAGLVRVFLGVESGVSRVKREFNKFALDEEFDNARQLYEKEFSLNVHIGFITIEPYSSLSDVEINIEYLMQIGKLFRIGIIIEPMRAIKGTLSYQRLLKDGLIEKDLHYADVTYGYKFRYRETYLFLQGIQDIFRLRMRAEAYKFEYYSTVVALLRALAIKVLGSLSAQLETEFAQVITIRSQGMCLLYDFLKYAISQIKGNPENTWNPNDSCSVDFIKKFKKISLEIELAYGVLVACLENAGAGRAVSEVYSGMEGIRA